MSKQALYEHNAVAQALNSKWGYLLEGIGDSHLRLNTAILLENENQKGSQLITEDPGTFSGQTANSTGYSWNSDGTADGADIAPFQHYLLPLVRRVYPNLIANELVGVQPMTSPASLVFYLKYKYTGLVDPDEVVVGPDGRSRTHGAAPTAKGETVAGSPYGNFSGNTWTVDPNYSLQTIFKEAVTDLSTTVDTAGVIAANAFATAVTVAPYANPVIANTLLVTGQLAFNLTEIGGDTVTITYDSTFDSATGIQTFANPVVSDLVSAGVLAGVIPASFTITWLQTDGSVSVSSAVDFTTITLDGTAVNNVVSIVSNVARTYDYNMEGNRQLPEMELQVESRPVTAKTRKLRTKWTIEASQDLRAMHNIDAEQELIAVLANEVTAEIDREILNDLVVQAAVRVDYDYANPFVVGGFNGGAANGQGSLGGTFAVAGVTSFDDRNKSLFYQILEVSNQIFRQSLRGAGNWVVTSPEMGAKLESLMEFKPDARTDTTYNMGIQYSGSLNGQFKLYKDPLFPPNLILVGFKGDSFMDAGYFYCPYVPLQLTPTVLDTESFNPRKGLITRYGKAMVENGNRMYGVIRVLNMTAIGADRLPGSDAVGESPHINGTEMQQAAATSDLTATGGQII